jgi:hypothetical protein
MWLSPPDMIFGYLSGLCPHGQGHAVHSLVASAHRADSVDRGDLRPRTGSECWEGDLVVFFPALKFFSFCRLEGLILSMKTICLQIRPRW